MNTVTLDFHILRNQIISSITLNIPGVVAEYSLTSPRVAELSAALLSAIGDELAPRPGVLAPSTISDGNKIAVSNWRSEADFDWD